jgi:hypothetical protein
MHKLNNPGPKSRTVCGPRAPQAMPTDAHVSGGGGGGGGSDAKHAGAHAGGLGGRHVARLRVCERGASDHEQSAVHRKGQIGHEFEVR